MAELSTEAGSKRPGGKAGAPPKIGIALGAGGAKGIAHIPMLEVLDELGITPHRFNNENLSMGGIYQ